MIENLSQYERNRARMNVTLKTGEKFTDLSVPDMPFGNHDRIVCFRHDGIWRTYPINDVACVEFVMGPTPAHWK